jgi:acetyltransferase (GNAT) family protein
MPNVRPLNEREALQAGRIIRLAFGTYLGAPDPESFFGDLDFVRSRFGAENVEAYGAEEDGVLLGSNFATRWGSVGFFGPLSIRPDRWDGGAAQPLVGAACEAFERWNVSHAGLFTFAQSAKHVHLYGKFGFYPRFLTAIMNRPAAAGALPARACYSGLADDERRAVEDAAFELTDAIYPGLDLRGEIRNVAQRGLGETLLLRDGEGVAGFAVCHLGPGTEAGSDQLFLKFGAVPSGPGADERFAALLAAASALAAARGMKTVTAGINLAREEAYRQMKALGFRTQMQGVAMHRGNESGYCRPGVYAIDDWR